MIGSWQLLRTCLHMIGTFDTDEKFVPFLLKELWFFIDEPCEFDEDFGTGAAV